ncbi:unnamed protein product, partial [Polarella glacialis]
KENVRRSYASKSLEDLREHYDVWAATYDEDQNARGYLGPGMCAETLSRYLPQSPDLAILDAGSGTGLGGESLRKLGYQRLTAMDLSDGMLLRARETGFYERTAQAVLGDRLPFASDEFDATVSQGTFTAGHAPPSGFDELLRVTRPGGFIVFSLKCDILETGGFGAKFRELTEAGHWELVEATEPKHLHVESKTSDPLLQIYAYRVL